MSQPFQFSMRRMFVSVAMICLAAWIIAIAVAFQLVNGCLYLAGAGTLIGAAIGNLRGKAINGAVAGFVVFWVLWVVVLAPFLMWYAMAHAGPGN
jgi:lipoprotein signal peptidase